MSLISKPKTFTSGTTILSADVNSDFDTIYNDYNGNITNANIAAGAAITDSKLASISTAGKVSGAALTSLSSTPSGAGILPFVNNYYGPCFSAHKNGTNQTAVTSGSFQKVTWSTELWDTNSNFASSAFTPTVAGKYYLTTNIIFTVGVDQTNYTCAIYKNGSLYKSGTSINCSGTGSVGMSANCLVIANGSTDFFEVYAFQNSGGDKIIDGTLTNVFFDGCLVSS